MTDILKNKEAIEETLKKAGRTLHDYKVEGEQFEQIVNNIFLNESKHAERKSHPIAFIVGGQPGAGKTRLIASSNSFLKGNCFVIDNDIYRSAHPLRQEIYDNYPELFTALTDQLSFAVTPRMIDLGIENKINIILHQTLKNNVIVDNAISKLKRNGYIVVVRALAVSDLESKMSMIERFQYEAKTTGIHRWVPMKNHDIAYNGMPETLDYMHKSNLCDIIEVSKRNDLQELEPIPIFRETKKNISEEQMQELEKINFPTQNYSLNDFVRTPRQAAEFERSISKFKCASTLQRRIENTRKKPMTQEELKRLDDLEQELNELQMK